MNGNSMNSTTAGLLGSAVVLFATGASAWSPPIVLDPDVFTPGAGVRVIAAYPGADTSARLSVAGEDHRPDLRELLGSIDGSATAFRMEAFLREPDRPYVIRQYVLDRTGKGTERVIRAAPRIYPNERWRQP